MSNRRTPEQEYQSEYYQTHKSERTANLRQKWQDDPVFRQKERERNKRRRALIRAEKAKGRFEAMVESKREQAEPTKPPRFIEIEGEHVQVWTAGSLGREIGRSARAVRTWIRRGDLPGASVFTRDGAAWFTREFCRAVRTACERLYYLNGRGDRRVLRRLIMEELVAAGISYVPFGAEPTARVVAS
jgi:hypothetical protein